jgi:hypothetical protein
MNTRKLISRLVTLALIALGGLAGVVQAQTGVTQDAYRAGFDAGFREGYERALADVRARQAQEQRQSQPTQQHYGSGNAVSGAATNQAPRVKNRGIVVVQATYGANDGRDRRSCDLTREIYGQAVGKVEHTISVSNQLCGDPAPSMRKSLRVTYLCGAEERVSEANEHRSLRLDCSN